MKSSFQKQEPILFNYRNYKHFNNDKFRNDLLYEFRKKGFPDISCEEPDISCAEFQFLFMTMLNKHDPMKIKYIRAKNPQFMNNDLSKGMVEVLVHRKKSSKF